MYGFWAAVMIEGSIPSVIGVKENEGKTEGRSWVMALFLKERLVRICSKSWEACVVVFFGYILMS